MLINIISTIIFVALPIFILWNIIFNKPAVTKYLSKHFEISRITDSIMLDEVKIYCNGFIEYETDFFIEEEIIKYIEKYKLNYKVDTYFRNNKLVIRVSVLER